MLKRLFNRWLVILFFLFGGNVTQPVPAAGTHKELRTWEDDVLSVQLQDVHFEARSLRDAWLQLSTKLLLRSVLYDDGGKSRSNSNVFLFDRHLTTAKALLEALLLAYPDFTYAQDHNGGVIWIFPKILSYTDILSKNISVEKEAYQLSVGKDVLAPLNTFLPPTGVAFFLQNGCNSRVDLPRGVCSLRDIVNHCCRADPNLAFEFYSLRKGDEQGMPVILSYMNPLAPPRIGAVRFWESTVGAPTNILPSIDEMRAALCDPNPSTRWAAKAYLRACPQNYLRDDIVTKTTDESSALWGVLALKSIFNPSGDKPYIADVWGALVKQAFANGLIRRSPGLALLISMELAMEKKDASLLDVMANQRLSPAEIAVIKPDFYEIARESKVVRDKLIQMKLDLAEPSEQSLAEIGTSDLFTLSPNDK